jgi:hypothetical protein
MHEQLIEMGSVRSVVTKFYDSWKAIAVGGRVRGGASAEESLRRDITTYEARRKKKGLTGEETERGLYMINEMIKIEKAKEGGGEARYYEGLRKKFQGKRHGGPILKYANGGPIDNVPILASEGEFMLSREDVQNLGGTQGVEAMRRGAGININVTGLEGLAQQFWENKIREGFIEYQQTMMA